ncbi:MAG TPA: hypothetical protein VEI04_00625 [Syntrophobacteria bacterium]|nr:hypothetical protein [Syntrophobacteria bacterium]
MKQAEAYNEALTILGNDRRHEVDKLRLLAAVAMGNTELDGLMPLAPKGAVSKGLRGLLEDVTKAYDRA